MTSVQLPGNSSISVNNIQHVIGALHEVMHVQRRGCTYLLLSNVTVKT